MFEMRKKSFVGLAEVGKNPKPDRMLTNLISLEFSVGGMDKASFKI